jgi:hypothetical protein
LLNISEVLIGYSERLCQTPIGRKLLRTASLGTYYHGVEQQKCKERGVSEDESVTPFLIHIFIVPFNPSKLFA